MVVILLVLRELTATKALLNLDRHDLKFGREVLLLFVVFHKHLCFKLIIALKTTQLQNGNVYKKKVWS